MNYLTLTLDDYWADGIFENCTVSDGKLVWGWGRDQAFTNLNILSLLLEGTGTLIDNVAGYGDGTLNAGAWGSDNVTYIQNPNISYPLGHFADYNKIAQICIPASFAIGSVYPHSAVIFIRNATAGTLISVGNGGLVLKIDDSGYFALTHRYTLVVPDTCNWGGSLGTYQDSLTSSLSANSLINHPNQWVSVGYKVTPNFMGIYVNGRIVASKDIRARQRVLINSVSRWGTKLHDFPIDGTFRIGPFTGDLRGPALFGLNTTPSELFGSNNASWQSAIIDLGDTYTLEKITHDGYASQDHDLDVNVRLFPSTALDRPEKASVNVSELHDEYPSTRRFYAQDYAYGRYLQVIISMTRDSISPHAPWLDNLRLRFRRL